MKKLFGNILVALFALVAFGASAEDSALAAKALQKLGTAFDSTKGHEDDRKVVEAAIQESLKAIAMWGESGVQSDDVDTDVENKMNALIAAYASIESNRFRALGMLPGAQALQSKACVHAMLSPLTARSITDACEKIRSATVSPPPTSATPVTPEKNSVATPEEALKRGILAAEKFIEALMDDEGNLLIETVMDSEGNVVINGRVALKGALAAQKQFLDSGLDRPDVAKFMNTVVRELYVRNYMEIVKQMKRQRNVPGEIEAKKRVCLYVDKTAQERIFSDGQSPADALCQEV